jgi:predicted RNA-binding protein with PUA-like domain
MSRYWLLKTEPDTFSIDDLAAAPQKIESWDGIRNYQSRNFIRDDLQVCDECFIYHSQCKQVGIVGVATVVKGAYPDPSQFQTNSRYFDIKASKNNPRWFCFDVKFKEKFPHPVLLQTIKQHPLLDTMTLIKQGRLSVQAVKPEEWQIIEHMAKEPF